MSLRSDLTVDASKFKPEAVSESTRQLNDALMQLTKDDAGWWQVRFPCLTLARVEINDYVDRSRKV